MLIFSHVLIKTFLEEGVFIIGILTELTKGTSHTIQVIHTLPIRHG